MQKNVSSKHNTQYANKSLLITIHSTKVQISSNVSLRFQVQLNDSELHSTKCHKVDNSTRVASF